VTDVLITDYTTLKQAIALELNRTSLTDSIPTFIQTFEAQAKRDERYRKLTDRGEVLVSSDNVALPSDFMSLESWYHDGSTYFGPIEIVSPDQIGRLKASYGATGVPQFAALVGGYARFAPEPDASYPTWMTYWRKIVSLSSTNTTNWLLSEHPDIYLYGALVESAPWLKDDVRIATWQQMLEPRLEALHSATVNAQWGGSMKRSFTPIGG
jgi:hypothetical protein